MENDNRTRQATEGRLNEAVRRLKIEAADRGDVVIDMKEADRARLELLADALKPVFDDVPLEDDRFDFALSSGLQPRLWVDATAHVMMGRDRRTYRFVRDTRLGRIVLAESVKMEAVEAAVVTYVAERLLERERMLAGDTTDMRMATSAYVEDRDVRHDKPNFAEAGHIDGGKVAGTKTVDSSAPQVPAKFIENPAEPSTGRAFGTFIWLVLGFVAAGAALLWMTGQLG